MDVEISHCSMTGTLDIDIRMFHAIQRNFILVLVQLNFLQLVQAFIIYFNIL